MRAWYLDASVALHAVLPDGDPVATTWVDDTRERGEVIVSSRLLRLEVIRTLRRDRQSLQLADALLGRVALLGLHDGILASAERIEPHVRSLDAIHLATALVSGLEPTVVTHDATMREVALILGLAVLDPLSPEPPS